MTMPTVVSPRISPRDAAGSSLTCLGRDGGFPVAQGVTIVGVDLRGCDDQRAHAAYRAEYIRGLAAGVVECMVSRLVRWRHLDRDHERHLVHIEAMFKRAMISLVARRIALADESSI